MAHPVIARVKRQRAEVEKMDAQNLQQVTDAYLATYGRLQGDIDALTLAIDAMDEPTAAKVKASPQYKRLVKNGTKELDNFVIYLGTVIGAVGVAGVTMGLSHSAELINVMAKGTSIADAIGGTYKGLQPSVMKPLLKYLDPSGPLYKRLDEITTATIESVTQSIIDGVGLGYNPQKIAKLIQGDFGGGLTDALRNTRTVQLYSYRDSARANYMATDGIVTGIIRYEELDNKTCMSCVAEHGKIRDLDVPFEGHYCCRGVDLPYIEQFGNMVDETGEDWFNGLTEEEQSNMMGKEFYSAYKGGAFTISDMSKPVENDVYGTMKTVKPLWELLGAEPPYN